MGLGTCVDSSQLVTWRLDDLHRNWRRFVRVPSRLSLLGLGLSTEARPGRSRACYGRVYLPECETQISTEPSAAGLPPLMRW